MLDFNTKKAVLRRLRAKRNKNKALWLPCVIAELCVKLWYTVLTGLSLALSGKNGKLLGIIETEKKTKARRQDDIVYVKRPFFGRLLSAVLAVSLILMFMPEIFPDLDIVGITAKADDLGTITIGGETFYQDKDDHSKLYPESEYKAARAYKVVDADFLVSNEYLKLGWEAASGPLTALISGYYIEISGAGASKPLYTDTVVTTNPVVDINETTPIKVNNKNNLTARIYAITKVPVWTLITDDLGNQTASPPTGGEYANITCADINAFSVTIGKLDAKLPMPTLQDIPDINDVIVDAPTITLKWNAVDGAYGYKIYKKEGDKAWEAMKGEVLNGGAAAGTEMSTSDTVKPGTRYSYFVEAYAFVWDGNAYNLKNTGMISSSAEYTSKTADEKARNVYNGDEQKSFYVAPAQPVLNTEAKPKDHLINLTWTYTGNADGIILVRSDHYILDDEWNGSFSSLKEYLVDFATKNKKINGLKKLTPEKSSKNSHDDKGDLIVDQEYHYYAIAYMNTNNGYLYSNYDYQPCKMSLSLDAPQNLRTSASDGKVEVTWDKVDNADGYLLTITKLTDDNGNTVSEPVMVVDRKDTKYTHDTFNSNDLLNGEKYEYKVQAYAKVTTALGDPLKGAYSFPRTATVGVPLNVTQNLNATTADGLINLSWDSVKGAEGYMLHYKYQKQDGSSSDYTTKTVFDVSGTKYTHKGLNNGDKFYYYVEAYKTVNGKRVYSDRSDEVWIIVGDPIDAPKDFTGTTTDGRVDLTWTAVKGAEGYIVHIISSNGTTQDVDVSKPAYSHIGLKNGDKYTYYVQAYKTVNGIRVYSDGSTSSANRVTITVGDYLPAPKDFDAVTSDGMVNISWTAVKEAEGYILYAYGNGQSLQFDLSKTKYDHIGLKNGETWTYYVVSYKTINGSKMYSEPTQSKTVTVGVSLNAAIDLSATAGNRQVDLSWSAVKGAEGYVVYLYNKETMEFEPITVVSGTKYSHVGLKNGKAYTYMVVPFKNINGKRYYGDYSMSVTAIPTTGSITDIDHSLNVKGTTPYGISHSEYISANANHGAFDESVDVYFTTNRESTNEVKDVLKRYAKGLKSFIIYPFDISIYQENTKIHVKPNDGYSVTITMPIPDRLIAYRDYLTVVHIGEATTTNSEANREIIDPNRELVEDWIKTADSRLQVLPSAVLDIDNVWCIQFVATEFSPYALVIYKDHLDDVSSGGGVINGSFAGTFNSGILLFTTLPDILPHNKKLKVVSKRKRYRIVKKG